ncbi:RES family NAD+ phosphorylase [Geobacter sp.]|uniref:RES family NAD+ phosphorylase n=1 Tax=Geobacter sp. TaxID=46610 RepID=UPI002637BC69|nr:RES family NAD+ phosphorylase [Geobacter sp.]
MLLYRIAEEQFAGDLSGEGARRYGGRWNPKGVPMIYTAESVALAALEVLIRLSTPKHYCRVVYELPDSSTSETIPVAELPPDWLLPHPNARLIEIGKRWAQSKRSLLLRVPSAVVRGEGWNYLINPLHPRFSAVAIADIAPFEYDARLLRKSP